MNEFIDLLNSLDDLGNYKAAETLFKTAFDLKEYTKDEYLKGQGAYGAFFTGFPKDKTKALGEPDLGLKRFFGMDNEAVVEFLAFKIFAPIINKHTLLKAPMVSDQSLSFFFKNRSFITKTIPGVEIPAGDPRLQNGAKAPEGGYNVAIEAVYYAVIKELKKVGIMWSDFHSGNIKMPIQVKEYFLDEFEKIKPGLKGSKANKVEKDFFDFVEKEILPHITIIDFGMFYAHRGSMAGQAVETFVKHLLEKNRVYKNKYISRIIDMAEYMLSDDDWFF